MPVYLRRDEMESHPSQNEPEIEEESPSLFQELFPAVRSCGIWLILGACGLIGGLTLMKQPLMSAEKLRRFGKGDYWQETWTPMALFAIFGGAIGFLLASRLSLSDHVTCIMVGFMGVILLIAGGSYATVLFPTTVPVMCWIGLGVMVAAMIGGAFFQTRWSA